MNDRDREFADAARVVEDSFVMRVVSWIVRRATLSGSPRARRLPALTASAKATASLAEAKRRRKGSAYGILIATGCLTHALLLQLMPDRIAPVKPLAYGMVLAFAAFATVAGFITMRSRATATADSSAGTANTRKS